MGYLFLLISSITAIKTSVPPVIDGILNDPLWEKAEFVSQFVQKSPNLNAEPTEKTEFAIGYDKNYLYIGIKAYQDPDKIVSYISRRDKLSFSNDILTILLDSYGTGQNCFYFTVNPSGSMEDGTRSASNGFWDTTWDGIWEVKTHIDSTGWSAEFRIPFSTLRFETKDTLNFRIEVIRLIAYNNENDCFPNIPEDVQNDIACFEPIEGITGIKISKKLSLFPYLRAGYFLENKRLTASTGIDIKYQIGTHITLDATVNPDFCQVEADPHLLNLSTYEIYYPEKRPFFIEGKNIFETSYQLFYSRRIGQLDYFYSSDSVISKPDAASIIGAFKITGESGNNTFGLLHAITDRAVATLMTDDDSVYTETIQPRKYYSVIRYKRNFTENTYAGILATNLTDAYLNSETAALVDGCFAPSDNIRFKGNFAFSTGKDTLWKWHETIGRGLLLTGQFSEKNHNLYITYTWIDTLFDINGMGYLWRNNLWNFHVNTWNYTTREFWCFRKISYGANVNYKENLQGYPLNKNLHTFTNMTFKNLHSLGISLFYSLSSYDDYLTRGGPPLKIPGVYGGSIHYSTDRTKKISGAVFFGYSEGKGFWSRNLMLFLNSSPLKLINFHLSYTLGKCYNSYEWVTNNYTDSTVDYVFGTNNSETQTLENRLSFNPTNYLSIQLWARAYITRGIFSGIKSLLDPDIPSFKPYTLGYSPDYVMKSMQIHGVLRWEYRKGSELYLVYTRDVCDYDLYTMEGIGLKDLIGLFKWKGNDAFTLKLNYRFNI